MRWLLGGAVGIALAGTGVYLVIAGLDQADKLASAAGVAVGFTGLAVSLYGAVLERRTMADARTRASDVVAGRDTYIAGGDFRISRFPQADGTIGLSGTLSRNGNGSQSAKTGRIDDELQHVDLTTEEGQPSQNARLEVSFRAANQQLTLEIEATYHILGGILAIATILASVLTFIAAFQATNSLLLLLASALLMALLGASAGLYAASRSRRKKQAELQEVAGAVRAWSAYGRNDVAAPKSGRSIE